MDNVSKSAVYFSQDKKDTKKVVGQFSGVCPPHPHAIRQLL